MSLGLHRFEAPAAGLNTEAAPDYVGKGQAPVLQNLIPQPGKVVMRGPLRTSSAALTGTPGAPLALWERGSEALLYASGAPNTLYRWAGGAVTTLDITATPAKRLGPSFTRIGDYTYGTSVDNAGTSSLLRWDGATTVTAYTTFPGTAPRAVKAYLNRLFVLDGRSLYWSDATTGLLADALTSFQDDVSGLTNKIVVNAYGEQPVGMAVGADGLLLFYSRSIHILRGKTPASFTLDTISIEVGCSSAAAIVEYGTGCFFMSEQGFMWCDGSSVQLVSGPVNTALRFAIANPLAGSNVQAARFEYEWLLLCTAGESFLFNPRLDLWVNFTSGAMAGTGAPLASVRLLSEAYLYDGTYFWSTPGYITNPAIASSSVRGFDERADGTKAAIESEWHSSLARIAPTHTVPAHRALVEYRWVPYSGSSDGWYVELVDGTGATIGSERQVLATLTQHSRGKYQDDRLRDVSDVQLRVSWRSSASPPPAIWEAEIYDCFLEYQQGRQRPNS